MKFSRALHSLFVGSRNNDCILRINGRACTMGYDKGQRDRKDDVMELRVLRYFLTVAQEGNISRAADILHVTQPTLSRQMIGCFMKYCRTVFLRYRDKGEKSKYIRIPDKDEKTPDAAACWPRARRFLIEPFLG